MTKVGESLLVVEWRVGISFCCHSSHSRHHCQSTI